MRILVTGGTGNIGKPTVDLLASHGHQVTVIGRREMQLANADYIVCDVRDFERLKKVCQGMDAIVHLAAIIAPMLAPGQDIFDVNCRGTFNVFQAAADTGIKRVVAASSINALGYFFGVTKFPILYFPIDEEHPTYTSDPYSFSKQIIEEIAAYFYRREGINSACLRFPAVLDQEGEFIRRMKSFFEPYPELTRNFARDNFWTLLDTRDAARAIELALTADFEGSHPLFINDSVNFAGIESEKLLQKYFPEVKARKYPIIGDETVVSIRKAQKLIGFEPQYSWRDIVRSPDSPLRYFLEAAEA